MQWCLLTATNSHLDKMMASIYQKLNKKLDALQEHKSHSKNTKETTKYTVHTRLQNVTPMKLSCEQISTSNFGFDCAIEKDPKQFINTFIIDTESAIRHLDIKIQNTCRYLATKKNQVIETSTYNTLYKRHQYNLKQIKILLERNNLIIAKADRGRTMVIIHKDTFKQKFDIFVQDN